MTAAFRTGPFIPRKPTIPTPKTSLMSQSMLLIGGNGLDPGDMVRLGNLTVSWQWPTTGFLDCRSNVPFFGVQKASFFTGALLTAIQAAGAGVKAMASNSFSPTVPELAILFDTLSPQVWYTDNYGASPAVWTPATGLPAGHGIDMAPGISFAEALAIFVGPATRKADDGITFGSNGTPASQINDVSWEEQQRNVYIAAAVGGVMKTIDGGAHWGYVRPHAVIGTTWPSGAVGRAVCILNAPVPAAASASLLIVGTTKYRLLGDNNDWQDQDGAAPTITGHRLVYLGGGATIVMRSTAGQMRYSPDKGATWTTRANPGAVTSLDDIDFDSGGTIWAVGINGIADGYIFSSIDAGSTWTQALHWTVNIGVGHIRVNPANSLQIAANYLSGGSGNVGFKFSTNGGASWTTHSLPDSTFLPNNASGAMQWIGSRLVCIFEVSNAHIYCKYTDDFGANWTQSFDINTGGSSNNVTDFITGSNLGPLFASITKLSTFVTGCILRSTSHGSSWDQLDAPFGSLVACRSLAYDVLSDTLFAIGDDGTVKSHAKASTTTAADWPNQWVTLPATGQSLANQAQAMVIAY